MAELPIDRVPAWARDLLQTRTMGEPLTRFALLKDTPFTKLAVGATATRTIVAEKGLFGAAAYELPAWMPEPARAPPEALPATVVRAKPRAGRKSAKRKTPVTPRRKVPAARSPRTVAATHDKGARPVESIEGIGEVYGQQLRAQGILTVRDLVGADPADLAERASIPSATLQKWQAMGRLQALGGIGPQYSELLVRAGIGSVDDLAAAAPGELLRTLTKYQESLEQRVQGHALTEGVVGSWIEEARRVRGER